MDIKYVETGDRSYWQASGMGPMRKIITEGETKLDAIFQYNRIYGLQYEEQERWTHNALEDRQ